MADSVKVPFLGTHSKGIIAGVTIGGFAVAGYLIYRNLKMAKDIAATSAASVNGAGYGYGSPGPVYPAGYYGYGEPGVYGYGASGGFPAGYYGYGTPQPQPAASTTNAQWAQAAINQLTQEGYDGAAVSAALGAYELGQPVSDAQVTIIQSAIGIEGYPPQAGQNGYPPAINHATGGGGSGQGGGGSAVVVPDIVGRYASTAKKRIEAAGLRFAMNPANPGGGRWRVTSQSPAGGTRVQPGSTVTANIKVV